MQGTVLLMSGIGRALESDNGGGSRNVRARLDVDEISASTTASTPYLEKNVKFPFNGGVYTFHMVLLNHFEFEEVKVVETKLHYHTNSDEEDIDALGDVVGYLDGYLIKRPSRMFYEVADAISGELQELSVTFCDKTGRANRIPSVVEQLDEDAIESGGFFQIYAVEVGRGHQGKCDLGLRIIHETFCFLNNFGCEWAWNIAVAKPCLLGSHMQKWPEENDRLGLRGAERSEIEEKSEDIKQASLKIQKHFSRMGFQQAGRNADQCEAWFITAKSYFGKYIDGQFDAEAAIARWKSKSDVDNIQVYVPPTRHKSVGIDNDLRRVVELGLMTEGHISTSTPTTLSAIEMLVLDRGASIHGARAMHLAAASGNESTSVLRLLVRLGGDVNAPDENGNSPLHIARHATPMIVLLGYGANRDAKNAKGETPLDSLLSSYQGLQDFADAFGGLIGGVSWDAANEKLDCILALMNPTSRTLLFEGWLSPRLRHMMQITADIFCDNIHDCPHDDGQLTNLVDCFGGEFLAPEVAEKNPNGLDKSFIDGWELIFQVIAQMIRNNEVPTLARIVQSMNSLKTGGSDLQNWQHYQELGGKADHALDALLVETTYAITDSGRGIWEYKDHAHEIESLPATPLDRAFDIARVKCFGLKHGQSLPAMGPYLHDADASSHAA